MSAGNLSRIEATGSDRPLLKDLYDHVVGSVAKYWKILGLQLLRSDQTHELDIIEINYPQDVIRCCKCILEKWLESSVDATWNQLIEALKRPSVGLNYFARELEQRLKPELVPATEPPVVPATKSAVTPATESAVVPACGILTSIRDIEKEFARMTTEVKNALINTNVDVAELIIQLCAISVVSNKKVPLFDEDVFTKVQSIDDLWKKLRGFWTIFDYEVLECVIGLSKCREAEDIFKGFMSRIDPSKIEDADLMLHCKEECWEGSLKPVLRVKIKTDKCIPKVKNKIKKVVSEVYKLKKYQFCFRGIRKGCIEMIYYISQPLKVYLITFAITKDNILKFLAHGIISLHIDDTDDEFELKVPTKIVDMNETLKWFLCIKKEDTTSSAMTQPPKFSARALVAEKLVKELDPEGDSRTLVDDDACLLYDKLYELAAREMDSDSAQRLTEGVIETVCRITLRYREKSLGVSELLIGFGLKLKARELFMMIGRFREETASYDDEEKARLLSLIKETGELLYQLDQEFRQTRKLDDALAFLGNSSTLDKLFMPNGVHSDIWSSIAEIFDGLSKGEILSPL